MDSQFTNPLDIDQLLLTKRLDPLDQSHIEALRKIENYDVREFTEAEVRAYIIDPILRILGYDKGTIFSADLEHPLKFLGRNRVPDYRLSLWNENFWLIEAKRPRVGEAEFGYEDLAQAIEYSVHPTVNAALVVLCDGLKVEIFDREVSVEAPVVRVRREDLVRDFDKIRSILEPVQIWFFQKRRIIRLLDKVFDKEFNMNRVEEFSTLLKGRLAAKRSTVVENFRSTVKPDVDDALKAAQTASLEEISELYLFHELPTPQVNAINRRLVALSDPNAFHVLYRIFPDQPRAANDIYMAQAVTYLIGLGEKSNKVQWLPAWLTNGGPQSGTVLEDATKFLLDQCMTYFSDYEPYRIILLAACAIRRIVKIIAISNSAVQKLGKDMHALARHVLPEISWAQIIASKESQLLGIIDAQAMAGLHEFISRNSGENGNFRSQSAKHELREFWNMEKRLLAAIDNYPQLLHERSLGEMQMTEFSSVTYDRLGHGTLCLMHPFPRWRAYLLEERRPLVEKLASLNSWAAKKMLGIEPQDSFGTVTDVELADRFFLGDVQTLQAIRAGYGGKAS